MRKRSRWPKYALWGVVCLSALAALAHTPPARHLVLGIVTSRLSSGGLAIDAEGLDYNLFTFTASLETCRIARATEPDAPLVRLTGVRAAFGPGILRGVLDVQSIEAAALAVSVRPSSTPGPSRPFSMPHFKAGRVDIQKLDVEYTDPDGGHHLAVTEGGLHLTGRGAGRLEGPFSVGRVTYDRSSPDVHVDAGRVEGVAVVDGDTLALQPSQAVAGGRTLALDGRVVFTGPEAGYALHAGGDVALALVNSWFPGFPRADGSVHLETRVTGRLSEPRADVTVRTDGLTWPGFALPRAEAEGTVTTEGVTVSRLVTDAGSSRLELSGHVGFRPERPSSVKAEWRGATPAFLSTALRQTWSNVPALASDGSAELAWTGLLPEPAGIRGHADGRVSAPGAADMPASVRATFDDGRWELHVDQTMAGDTHLRLDTGLSVSAASFGQSVLSGTLSASSADAPAALARLGAAGAPVFTLPPGVGTLPLSFDGELSGTVLDPRLKGHLSSDAATVENVGALKAGADLTATVETLSLAAFRVTDEHGAVLEARGDLSFAGRHTGGTLSVRGLSVSRLAPWLPQNWTVDGTIDADGTWSGTLANPTAEIRISGRDVEVNRAKPGSIQATVTVSDGVLRAEADVPALAATLTGSLELADRLPFQAAGSFDRTDVALLAAAAPASNHTVEASGSATGRVELSGPLNSPGQWSTRLRLEAFDGTVARQPLRVADPAELRLTPAELAVSHLTVQSGGASLIVDGRIGRSETGTLSASLLAPPSAVKEWLGRWQVTPRLDLEAQVSADLRATGTMDALSLGGRARAAVDRLRFDDRTIAEGIRADVSVDNDAIQAGTITGTVLGGPLELSVTVPAAWATNLLPGGLIAARGGPAQASLQGRLTVPLGALIDLLGESSDDEVSGSVSLSVDASAVRPAIEAVDATASIALSKAALGEAPFSLSKPAIVVLRNGRVSTEGIDLRSRATSFVIAGYADVVTPGDTNLRLTAAGPLAFLAAVLPGRASGTFVADVRLAGPAGARRPTGTVSVEEAALIVPAYRLALTDWTGRVDLTPESLTALDVKGQVNGGSAALSGTLPLKPEAPARSTFALSVRDAFLEIVKGLKSQVDADLDLQAAGDGFRLGGSVIVASGAYREPITAMAALFSQSGTVRPGGAPAPGKGALDRVALNVQVGARAPIFIENSLGRVDLTPDMRLVGTLAEPALSGSLKALEGGHLTLAGRRYELLESQILFNPRDGWVPQVNLSGETRAGEYTINLRVRGPVNELETSATSTPPLSERDLRSLLVTGRTTDLTSSGEDQDFTMEAVSSELLGFAGQMVGLDSLQIGRADFDIGTTDVNPATRLTVTKSLSPRLRVIVSENLENNRLTWIIVADSLRGYEFHFSQRDNREEVLEFRHQLEFGPGTSARRAGPRTRRPPRPQVSSVTFSGTPGVPAGELQGVVKIRAGRPFEIEQWQRDRERLEVFFREHGYATARITPRRTVESTPAGERMAVEYRIERGPKTVLAVEGDAVPDRVARDILAAWSAAVLPELLRDEAVRIVRQDLAKRNRLQPAISLDFDSSTEDVEIARLRVDEGPAVDSKLIVFEGNQALSASDLSAAGQADGSVDLAWVDSGPLTETVAALYRERGYFNTAVRVAPVAIEGGRATLRVHIDEGVRSRIGAVRFDGVPDARLPAVRTAAGLETGAVYLPSADRDARARLRRWYDDQGFKAADVAVARSVERDGAVSVTFTVTEGPQSIVTAVRVEGLEFTRPGTVARAVTLEPGRPAGAATANDTQNRLYALGMFRSAEVRFEPASAPATLPDGQVPVDAVVSLSEAKRFQLRYGVQLSNAHGPLLEDIRSAFGVAGDARDRNFLGRGLTLGASGRYERDLQTARALLFLPRSLNQRLESNFFATWRNERSTLEDLDFRDTRKDLTVEERLHLRRGIEIAWGYSYYWRNFRLSREGESADLGGTLASLQASFIVDRRDSVFDARHGWFHSQNVQFGLQKLGSDVSFTRYILRQYVYVPAGPLVLASGVRWGTLARIAGVPPLTILDLFFNAGGTQTVRGYAQDALWSLELFDVPVGGTNLLIFNEEVRFPVFKWIRGAAFVDAGNTFGSFSDVSLSGLAVGVGFGLRIQTPLAPFRIDLGFPVGPFGKGGFRWHFSIGEMF